MTGITNLTINCMSYNYANFKWDQGFPPTVTTLTLEYYASKSESLIGKEVQPNVQNLEIINSNIWDIPLEQFPNVTNLIIKGHQSRLFNADQSEQ